MMKILIGHDGSQSADAALVDLQRAGLPDEAEALIVSVADTMLVVPTPDYELSAHTLMSRRVSSGLAYARIQTAHVLEEAKRVKLKIISGVWLDSLRDSATNAIQEKHNALPIREEVIEQRHSLNGLCSHRSGPGIWAA